MSLEEALVRLDANIVRLIAALEGEKVPETTTPEARPRPAPAAPPAAAPAAAPGSKSQTAQSSGTPPAQKKTGPTTLAAVASGDPAPSSAEEIPEQGDERYEAVLRGMQRAGELPDEWGILHQLRRDEFGGAAAEVGGRRDQAQRLLGRQALLPER